jgi:hypothetical protein
MARAEIPFVVSNSAGASVAGATVTVSRRDGSTNFSVYASESGTTTLPNPITTGASGRIDAWLEEGSYNLEINGPGITTYTQAFDAVAAGVETRRGGTVIGNVGPASEAAVAFGNPVDASIYRSAAGEIRTSASIFRFDGSVRVNQARLIGAPTSLSLRDSADNNIISGATASGNFTDNANGTRLELDTAARANAVLSGLGGIALSRLGISATGVVVGNVAVGALAVPSADKFRIDYAGGRDTLHLTSESGETGITFGDDVELYRRADSVLSTPDIFEAAAYRVGTTALASTHLDDTANIALLAGAQTFTGTKSFVGGILSSAGTTGTNVISSRVTGESQARLAVTAGGDILFGDGATTPDVQLGRASADVLRTPDAFQAGGIVVARQGAGAAAEVTLGNVGPASEAALRFGADAILYRSAADTFRTADSVIIDANLLVGTTTQRGRITLPTATTTAGGISFGDSATAKTDRVDLFRSAAGVVTLDGNITVTGNLTVSGTTTQQSTQTSTGPVTGTSGNPGQVTIGNTTPAGDATVYWGQSSDTTLYRTAAGALRTPGTLTVDGLSTLTGGVVVAAQETLRRAAGTDTASAVQTGTTTRLSTLASGQVNWHDATGVSDTSLARTNVGVLTLTGTLNASVGYQVGGTALAASHLSNGTTGTGAIVLATSPTVSNLTVGGTLAHGVSSSPVGTAGAPSRAFEGDLDTGMYSPGANQIGFATGGTARLTIAADGTVNAVNGLTVAGNAVLRTDTTAGGDLSGTFSNLQLGAGVVANAEVATGAAIAQSKLALAITNAEVAASAGIVDTKLATITTSGKVAPSSIAASDRTGTGTFAFSASPTLTGTPGAPTAALDTNTTQLATTAFVLAQANSPNNAVFRGVTAKFTDVTPQIRQSGSGFAAFQMFVGDQFTSGSSTFNSEPRFEIDVFGTLRYRAGVAAPAPVISTMVGGNGGFVFYAGADSSADAQRLSLTSTGISFFDSAPVARITAPSQGAITPAGLTAGTSGTPSTTALTTASTLNDVIYHLSRLMNSLQSYGLLGNTGWRN